MNLAFLNIGTQEMMLIILVALLLFGGKKLPELARGLGRGIREFKDASEGIKREISDQINNFEKEIDDIKTDIEKEPETSYVQQDTPVSTEQEETQTTEDGDQELAAKEKKAPQFTAPAGTYEHQPYQTPTQDDYYSYGYNDHFANNEQEESPAAQADEAAEAGTPSPDAQPTKEDDTKNA